MADRTFVSRAVATSLMMCFALNILGCVRYETYQEVTNYDLNSQEAKGSADAICLADESIEFRLHFREMTRSFSDPSSRLHVLSQNQSSIFIERVVVYSESGSYQAEMRIDKCIDIQGRSSFSEQYYETIPLFSSDNVDLEALWKEPLIQVELHYRGCSSDAICILTIEFALKEHVDVAWPT